MTHSHDHHDHGTTVLDERDGGPATALTILIVAALIGFLIWLFAFSGVVFDRGADDTDVRQNQFQTEQQDTTNDGGTGGGQQSPDMQQS